MAARASRSVEARAAEWVAVACGASLLVLRGELAVRGLTTPTVLVAIYAAVTAASLWGSQDPPAHRGPILWAAVVGLLALAAARTTVGPTMPAPMGTWAVPLGAAAAIAEELFFRRLLYRRLLAFGAGAAIAVTAVAFAAIHVPLYGPAAFWVDLGAGLLFGWQRWASGSWLAPAATHAAANVLAVLS